MSMFKCKYLNILDPVVYCNSDNVNCYVNILFPSTNFSEMSGHFKEDTFSYTYTIVNGNRVSGSVNHTIHQEMILIEKLWLKTIVSHSCWGNNGMMDNDESVLKPRCDAPKEPDQVAYTPWV